MPTSASKDLLHAVATLCLPMATRELRTANAWSRSSSTDYATAPSFSGREHVLADTVAVMLLATVALLVFVWVRPPPRPARAPAGTTS